MDHNDRLCSNDNCGSRFNTNKHVHGTKHRENIKPVYGSTHSTRTAVAEWSYYKKPVVVVGNIVTGE